MNILCTIFKMMDHKNVFSEGVLISYTYIIQISRERCIEFMHNMKNNFNWIVVLLCSHDRHFIYLFSYNNIITRVCRV